MKPWTKAGIKAGLLTFVIVLPLNLFIHEICVKRDAERTIQPPPVEAPATTATNTILPPTTETTEKITAVAEEITAGDSNFEAVAESATTEPGTEPLTAEPVSETYTLPDPVTECYDDGYIGTFYITGYTAEEGFLEGSATASGYGARPGYCAINSDRRRALGISWGDQVYVEGLGTFTVMDSGCDWNTVDIWCYTDAYASDITGYYDVYYG